jgi:hypothetical protein
MYIAFFPRFTPDISNRNIRIKPFLDSLKNWTDISDNQFLSNISFGNEIYEGQGKMTVTNYTVNLTEKSLLNDAIAFYPFNGNANDESGNGNNGTVNGPALTKDRFDKDSSAYLFNGNGNNINCGKGSSLQIEGDITIYVWTKLQTTTHGQVIVNKYSRTGGKGWLIETNSSGTALFNIRTGTSDNDFHSSGGNSNIFDNNWHFLVGQRSGNKIKIFIDGIMNSEYNTNNTSSFNSTVDLMIGVQSDRPSDPAAFSKGIIDDIRIYNRVLSEAEIQQLFHEGGL